MSRAAAQEHIADLGPAMQVLTEKQRRYVLALFEAPKKYGRGVFAAERAGYQAASRGNLSVIASQLSADPKVQAAITEVSQARLTILGPTAVDALEKLLENPKHRDHGRALGMVMDRVAPALTTSVVKVEGEVKVSAGDAAVVLARIEELSRRFMVSLPAPKVIEHDEAAA
jgi:phage terminase small subunit